MQIRQRNRSKAGRLAVVKKWRARLVLLVVELRKSNVSPMRK
jgi:hypothetical protein